MLRSNSLRQDVCSTFWTKARAEMHLVLSFWRFCRQRRDGFVASILPILDRHEFGRDLLGCEVKEYKSQGWHVNTITCQRLVNINQRPVRRQTKQLQRVSGFCQNFHVGLHNILLCGLQSRSG